MQLRHSGSDSRLGSNSRHAEQVRGGLVTPARGSGSQTRSKPCNTSFERWYACRLLCIANKVHKTLKDTCFFGADLTLYKERQQQLQQEQKALTELLEDQGDLGQSLLDAVV